MHLPPAAAVLRVSQLTTSPASSLWNVYEARKVSLIHAETYEKLKLTIDLVEWR